MKMSPDKQRITEAMAPGVLNREGFLGGDTRDPWTIIETDRSTLTGLGLTCQQVAEALEKVQHAVEGRLGTPVDIGDDLIAGMYEVRGGMPCPFGDVGMQPKGEIELTQKSTGKIIHFSPLSVHMIAAHCFFQGKGSRYRLEPEEVVQILKIK